MDDLYESEFSERGKSLKFLERSVREMLQERPAVRDSASEIPRAQIFTGLCVFAALVISLKRKNSESADRATWAKFGRAG